MAMSDSALIFFRRTPGDEFLFAINDNEEIYAYETKADREMNAYQVAWTLTEAVFGVQNSNHQVETWDLEDDEERVRQFAQDFTQGVKDFLDHRLGVPCDRVCEECSAHVTEDEIGHIENYNDVWCDECTVGHTCMCCETFYEDENELLYVENSATPIGYSGNYDGDVCVECLDRNHEEWEVPCASEHGDGTLAHNKGKEHALVWMEQNPAVLPDPHMHDWHAGNADHYFEDFLHEDLGYIWESPCLKETFIAAWCSVCTGGVTADVEQVVPEAKCVYVGPNQVTIIEGERAKPEWTAAVTDLATVLAQATAVKERREEVVADRRSGHAVADLSVLLNQLMHNVDPNHIPF